MKVSEFLKETSVVKNDMIIRPWIVCADGFTMSVQASKFHYCTPRENVDTFSKVEIGYPSMPEERLRQYAEDESDLTDTVFGWVPIEIVESIVEQHGGIVNQAQ